jgi:hypothetical protein
MLIPSEGELFEKISAPGGAGGIGTSSSTSASRFAIPGIDCARFIGLSSWAHLCVHGADGCYNFTAPESVAQAQFSRVAASVLKRPSGVPTPGFPMRFALGEQADLLLEGQRVVPERLLRSGFVFRYPRLDAALRSLV